MPRSTTTTTLSDQYIPDGRLGPVSTHVSFSIGVNTCNTSRPDRDSVCARGHVKGRQMDDLACAAAAAEVEAAAAAAAHEKDLACAGP